MAKQHITPEYERPPVVETILGVQFDAMPGLTNAHLGAFWASLDSTEWISVMDLPPLQSQFERFSESARWVKGLQIQVSQVPQSRLQIKNKTADRMIQVQNGRLHVNWLGDAGGDYPRYAKVKEDFVIALEKFLKFVESARLGEFQPDQWEVTYINHIPRGTVWYSPADWGFFKPLGAVPTIESLIEAESFTGEWHFVIPPEAGRLHVGWQHALKNNSDQTENEIVQLTLTARGPMPSGADPKRNLIEGLDIGHDTIVRTFARLMSTEANTFWGLKNVAD